VKSSIAGSIAVAIGMIMLTPSPSHSQPANPVQGFGPAQMPSVQDAAWRGRGAWGGGARAFRGGGARAFRGGGGRAFGGGGGYAFRGGGYGYRHGGGAAAAGIAGLAAGALIGGALASPGYAGPGYYGGGYYGGGYYVPDAGYYAPSAGYYTPAPAYPAGGAVAYCESRYRTYDPASGTYMGNDGLRHPCP
jgi:BA14K-like protein